MASLLAQARRAGHRVDDCRMWIAECGLKSYCKVRRDLRTNGEIWATNLRIRVGSQKSEILGWSQSRQGVNSRNIRAKFQVLAFVLIVLTLDTPNDDIRNQNLDVAEPRIVRGGQLCYSEQAVGRRHPGRLTREGHGEHDLRIEHRAKEMNK